MTCNAADGTLAEGERSVARTKKAEQAAGGKPCFYEKALAPSKGQTKTEVCHFHDNAAIDIDAEKAQLREKDKIITALKEYPGKKSSVLRSEKCLSHFTK